MIPTSERNFYKKAKFVICATGTKRKKRTPDRMAVKSPNNAERARNPNTVGGECVQGLSTNGATEWKFLKKLKIEHFFLNIWNMDSSV